MNHPEVDHYAGSFASEIHARFSDAVRASSAGLAKLHGLDSVAVEQRMWLVILEELQLSITPDDESAP